MKNGDAIRWMEQQGHLCHWMLPELGVKEGTASGDYTVGNSPEVMPLGCSLFNYLDEGVNRHAIIT